MPSPHISETDTYMIGIGWVPNISGRVTSSVYLKRCLSKSDPFNIVEYEEDGARFLSIPLAPKSEDHFYVRLDDDSGKCTLFGSSELKAHLEEKDYNWEVAVNLTWKFLRHTIDSSSKPLITEKAKKEIHNRIVACSCSAMDAVIIAFDEEGIGFYERVIRQFESVSEDLSDNLRGLTADKFIMDRACLRYNQLYTESFINLYGDSDEETKLNKIVELRYRKANIISEYIDSTIAREEFETNKANAERAINDSKVFKWSFVVASIACIFSAIALIWPLVF